MEPHNHRVLAAERCIHTFKNHFIAGLATTDPDFPFYLWDKLLQQAEITINLLRNSRQHPKISAYTHMWGNFDFNKTPLAPPGTKAVIFEDPDTRESWGPHGKKAFYIGPAMEHYHNQTFYILEIEGTQTSTTAQFFPHQLEMPKISPSDALTIAASDLIEILKNSESNPVINLKPEHYTALKQAAKIFNTASKQPKIVLQLPSKPILNEEEKEEEPGNTNDVDPKTKTVPKPQPKNKSKENNPFKIPFQENEINRFNRFIQQPATYNYPTRNKFQPHIIPVCGNIIDDKQKNMSYRQLIKSDVKERWLQAMCKELGRLSNGYKDMTPGMKAIEFMNKEEVEQIPKDKSVMSILIDIMSGPSDPYRRYPYIYYTLP